MSTMNGFECHEKLNVLSAGKRGIGIASAVRVDALDTCSNYLQKYE